MVTSLTAAVAATGLASLHGGKGHLLVLITSLFGVTTTATSLASLHWGKGHLLVLIASLLGMTTAAATESERA
jgi:hypothetical protein